MVVLQKPALRHGHSAPERVPTATRCAQTVWRQGAPVRLSFYPNGAVVQRQPDPAYDVRNYHRYLSTAVGQNEKDQFTELVQAGFKSIPSTQLRASMMVSGVQTPTAGEPQAHHIVETSNQWGQALLQALGIDSNSAANGVFLPSEHCDDTGNASIHRGSHVAGYQECVNQALICAINFRGPDDLQNVLIPEVQRNPYSRYCQAVRDNVLLRLRQIRDVLLTRNVPLNIQGDANWVPNDQNDNQETIADIFRDAGLIPPSSSSSSSSSSSG